MPAVKKILSELVCLTKNLTCREPQAAHSQNCAVLPISFRQCATRISFSQNGGRWQIATNNRYGGCQTVDQSKGFRQFNQSFRPPFSKGGTDPTPWGVVSQGTIGAGNSATQKFPPQAAKAPHLAFLLVTFLCACGLKEK